MGKREPVVHLFNYNYPRKNFSWCGIKSTRIVAACGIQEWDKGDKYKNAPVCLRCCRLQENEWMINANEDNLHEMYARP